MKKERLLILINFFAANVITAFIMSLFSVYFLHRDISLFIDNSKTKLLMSVLASVLTCAFLNWKLNGLARVLEKLKEGAEVTLQERMKARSVYKTLITTTLIIIFSGFTLAPLIVYIIKIIKGTNDPYVKMAVGLLMSIGFSCVTVMYLISRFGHILMKPFNQLGIHNILRKDKDQSFTRKRLLSFAALSFFILSTLLTAFFGLLYTGLENLDPVKTFIEIALAGFGAVLITIIINYFTNAEDRDRINLMEQSLEHSINNTDESSRLLNIIQCDELGRLSSTMNTYMKRMDNLLEQIGTAGSQISSQASIMEESINNAENSVDEMSRSNSQVKETLDKEMKAVSDADEAVSQIATSVDQISNAVESQASFVEQSSASIEEMTANITSVHSTTLQAKDLTDQLNRVISSGSEKVSQTLSYISEIRNVSDEMQSIVTVISKISAQTNLLAMNAAIEAAHAGKAGKGFSVVADEVRTLAEGSAKSAKSIGELIKQMIETIDRGVEQSGHTETAFNNIAETVSETSQMIYTITQAMEEQRSGAMQIREAVTALVQATENIKKESMDQKEKSSRMMNVFSDLLNLFSEVEKASQSQDSQSKAISAVIDRLKDISDKNMALVGNLNEAMKKK